MQYPYISTSMNNFLFYAKDTATLIGDESNQFSHGFKLTADESKFNNDTFNFMQDKYGAIESDEHLNFIIKIAENAGISVDNTAKTAKSFVSCNGFISIYSIHYSKLIKTNRERIIIPLPPKP